MSAISIVNAKKNYGNLDALKGVNLEVRQGEFFGLLGPNGAGKSTLIHSIVGLCELTEGNISVMGHDVRNEFLQAHSYIGFAPQEMNLDRFFSIKRILMYQAGFFNFPRHQRAPMANKLLQQFHLEEKANLPYYRLSGGMQKRLLVAKAAITNPKILILDEPTAGIDVEQRHQLWDYLRKLNLEGTTIILTTHYIDEAEALCERIGIIHLGEIKELGSPKSLIDKYCEKKICVQASEKLNPNLFAHVNFRTQVKENIINAWGPNVGHMTNQVHQIIHKNPPCEIQDIHIERGSLEDVFLRITGSRIEENTLKETSEKGTQIADQRLIN